MDKAWKAAIKTGTSGSRKARARVCMCVYMFAFVAVGMSVALGPHNLKGVWLMWLPCQSLKLYLKLARGGVGAQHKLWAAQAAVTADRQAQAGSHLLKRHTCVDSTP